MTIVAFACLAMLVVAGAGCLWRVARAPQLTDKAIALDVVTAAMVCGIAVAVAWAGTGVLVELVLALSLVGFLATVAIARFVGQRGA